MASQDMYLGHNRTRSESMREARDIIQGLAVQSQTMESIYWLIKLQVLACIPPEDLVAFEDIAHIVQVPREQISKVIRLTATVGFLCEPQHEHVGHTPLSIQLLRSQTLQDAAVFHGDAACLPALDLARSYWKEGPKMHGYNALNQPQKLFGQEMKFRADDCKPDFKVQRRSIAFQRLLLQNDLERGVVDVLSGLDWSNLGPAVIIGTGPLSTAAASALACSNQSIRVVVQEAELEGRVFQTRVVKPDGIPSNVRDRIYIQHRLKGRAEPVEGACVYVLHLSAPPPFCSASQIVTEASAELRTCLALLRKDHTRKLIILAQFVPDGDSEVSMATRAHDVLLMKTAGSPTLFSVQWLENLVRSVHDGAGRFVVSNRKLSKPHSTLALQVNVEETKDW